MRAVFLIAVLLGNAAYGASSRREWQPSAGNFLFSAAWVTNTGLGVLLGGSFEFSRLSPNVGLGMSLSAMPTLGVDWVRPPVTNPPFIWVPLNLEFEVRIDFSQRLGLRLLAGVAPSLELRSFGGLGGGIAAKGGVVLRFHSDDMSGSGSLGFSLLVGTNGIIPVFLLGAMW